MTLPVSPPTSQGPWPQTTNGISRNLNLPPMWYGGDQNGTAATSIVHGQSGTAAHKISVPRLFHNAGNFCGTV